MLTKRRFAANGWIKSFLLSIFAVLYMQSLPAAADTPIDDVRKVVWQLGGDEHIFYHKSADRWEAVKYGTSAPWGGYQKSVVGNTIKLQANATDFVSIDIAAKKVTLSRSAVSYTHLTLPTTSRV